MEGAAPGRRRHHQARRYCYYEMRMRCLNCLSDRLFPCNVQRVRNRR
jgi:hypothetical protein